MAFLLGVGGPRAGPPPPSVHAAQGARVTMRPPVRAAAAQEEAHSGHGAASPVCGRRQITTEGPKRLECFPVKF